MEFQRVNRSDAERVFAIFYNIAGATITGGYPAVWDISSVDGISVSKPATATLSTVVGIAVESIADSAYGKFQVYGYRSQAYITNDTSITVTAGQVLIAVAAQWYLDLKATGTGDNGFFYAGEEFDTNATPAAAQKKILIRCL